MGVAMEVKQPAPRWMHLVFACLAVVFLAMFSWVLTHEETAEWRTTQERFAEL
jgi:hypothetical protein